ncbi:BACON domain-containing protein [Streptomyces sp. NPDC054784]
MSRTKSSRREHPPHTTGAHRAHSARRPSQDRRSDRYGPYLDGLFTYCLSVMCDHDAATAALGEALAVAERQCDRDRAPADRGLRRPWLYALARWACLRRLSDGGDGRTAAPAPQLSGGAATQRRRELAALAWPEAAGTTPEQREALELAVRHGLTGDEVAAVLSLSAEAASELLTSAACEVERTRAALAVVESGGCPAVARLAGDDRLLLGTALRRELVRHVDDCAECRRVAERAMAGVSWPGTAPVGAAPLAVLQAPRPAVHAALHAVQRARATHSPRFGRNGFPVELKHRAARRDRIRSRAVTTTVVATVIAAPVLALWAAYRSAPLTGEGRDSSVSATDREGDSINGDPYENAGRFSRETAAGGRGEKDLSVGVEESDGPGAAASRTPDGTAKLLVEAHRAGGATVVTLTAAGPSPVRWFASTDASWLSLSRTSGVLRPGESTQFAVYVDEGREPPGRWSARIHIAPAGAVVTVRGQGRGTPTPHDPPGSEDPTPSDPAPGPTRPDPRPSDPGPSDPEPSDPTPTDPPSSEDPSPSDPEPSSPSPS